MRSKNDDSAIAAPPLCVVEGCDSPVLVVKRGLCRPHYNRWQRHGDPTGGGLPRNTPPAVRFEHYVERTATCWLWTGPVLDADRPYGVLGIGTRKVLAHRWSYEHHVGLIAEGTEIDHLCRNLRCVRPTHLEAVTHQTNILRGESPAAGHARKACCPRGHDYTVVGKKRVCVTCRDERSRQQGTHTGVGRGGVQRSRTHCKQGHEFTAENTYVKGNGCRSCRACHRRNVREAKQRLRAG